MIPAAVFLSHVVVAVIVGLWGLEYGVRVGDNRGVLGIALSGAVVLSGVIWAIALS